MRRETCNELRIHEPQRPDVITSINPLFRLKRRRCILNIASVMGEPNPEQMIMTTVKHIIIPEIIELKGRENLLLNWLQ